MLVEMALDIPQHAKLSKTFVEPIFPTKRRCFVPPEMTHFMANSGFEVLIEAFRREGNEIFAADATTTTWHNKEFHIIIAGIGFEQAGIELQSLTACDQRRVGICIGKVGIDYFECTAINGHLL